MKLKVFSQVKNLAIMASLFLCQPLFSDSVEDFDKFIERVRVQYHVPGASVVVVKDNQIAFIKGYGQCSIDLPQKVDGDTIFQLASVTKTFTSAALGIQLAKAESDWDEEVINLLPEFVLYDPYPSRYASSRDLLAHRTGLPAFTGDLLGKIGYSREEVLERMRFIEPEVSFREKALYSNICYFAAGQVVANLADSTYEKTVQSTLLDPLKMTRTFFADNIQGTNVALPHVSTDGKVKVVPRDTSQVFAAAGGLASTAKDMANWMIMQLNEGAFEGKAVMSSTTVKAMHAPSIVCEVGFTDLPPINEHSSLSYGLGWVNYNYKGNVIVEKGGALDGVRSIVVLIPKLKLGITVLANLNLTVLPELIRARFLEDHLGKYDGNFEKEFAEHAKSLDGLVDQPKKPEGLFPLGHPLDSYAGSFENDLYGTLTVSVKDKNLQIEAGPGRWKGELIPWGNNTFLLHWPMVNSGYQQVTFMFGPTGKPRVLQTEAFGVFLAPEEK